MNEQTFKRANRITASVKDGVLVGNYFKTHEKIATVKSDDPLAIANGLDLAGKPDAEGKVVELTGQEKMEAFKAFLASKCTVFGVAYDAVDRRDEENKFPSKYDVATLGEYAVKMVVSKITDPVGKIQAAIDKLVTDGLLPAGAELEVGVDEAKVESTSTYPDGHLKYAKAEVPVTMGIGENSKEFIVPVDLVSGQLKKPTIFGGAVFTMTGIKGALVEAGILPKVEPKAKKSEEATEAPAEESAAE